MKIDNLIRINDWKIGRFLTFVLSVQFAFLAVAGLNALGFDTPVFVQVISFIYLAFVPGIVILRVLRLHELGTVETLVFSVGLSIAFIMFLGVLMNALYSFVISGPVSVTTLTVTMSIAVLALSLVSYIRDRDYSLPFSDDVKNGFSLATLALCLLPLLSVFGTYLMNFYDSNIILLAMLFVLSLLPIAVVFGRIPPKLYPIAVFVTSISLLYHTSLISTNLSGWDIHVEYYFANLVRANSYWDPTPANNINAMLSVVMLAPIFSDICKMNLVAVLKTIYPLLFSMVPLGLYRVFQKQTNDKIAFLSSFFFMATWVFYSEMVQLARQQIASLFLVLLMLLIVEGKRPTRSRSALFIVFSFSLVVSHYGLTYVFLLSFILAWLFLIIARRSTAQTLKAGLYSRIGRLEEVRSNTVPTGVSNTFGSRFIAAGYVLLFAAFTFTWYIYVSGSSALSSITSLISHILSTISTEFFNPRAVQGLSLLVSGAVSPLHDVNWVLYVMLQLFIVIGFIASILRNGIKFTKEYVVFSFVSLIVALACVTVPYFASALNTSRLYQITLFFLAPFCVIGGITLLGAFGKMLRTTKISPISEGPLKIVSILLAVFLLFNSGFIYEMAKDHPASMSLNSTVDYPRFSDSEVRAAVWMTNLSGTSTLWGDAYGRNLLFEFAFWRVQTFWGNTTERPYDAYIYFRSRNVKGEVMWSEETYPGNYTSIQNSPFFNVTLGMAAKVYDDGGAQVYRPNVQR